MKQSAAWPKALTALTCWATVTPAMPALNRALTAAVGPVCIAGSVNSYARLAEIRAAGAAYFTIGSAFLTMVFGDDFAAQIDAVCAYMEADHA